MTWLENAIAKCVKKTQQNARMFNDFPHVTEQGKYGFTPDGVWTGGFWAGVLWLSWHHSKDHALLERATHFTERLLPRANDIRNHDLGFMFYPAALTGWRLTGNETWKKAAITAAHSLGKQFNPQGGFIPGWGFFGGQEWSNSVLIDTLMNLPLLVWAVKQGADRTLLHVVHTHTEKALAHHLREDGSVYHVYHFDEQGKGLRGDTYQGMGAESRWARGQAWAVTGLAILAHQLNNDTYLAAAEKVAAFIINHLPADTLPQWDYDADAHSPKDASAGAISAYGLLRLYRLTGKKQYLMVAESLLKALSNHCILVDNEGLLAHATADLPHGLGIDQATGYGDYYFLKALTELQTIR
ncbi:glucuronyl hydrolase [Paramixta manurensis]|uniref:Glucuronyl hydrolase n=1 Tax=Paramixta manurensis TaxID=2740817 RepID=A0A6M8UGI6_9GAMM|nr:glucuronyl hydrolase [Erwiniaceae bacterium PD-1]